MTLVEWTHPCWQYNIVLPISENPLQYIRDEDPLLLEASLIEMTDEEYAKIFAFGTDGGERFPSLKDTPEAETPLALPAPHEQDTTPRSSD